MAFRKRRANKRRSSKRRSRRAKNQYVNMQRGGIRL